MSALDIKEYVTDEADSRGRFRLDSGYADAKVTYIVYDPDTLERVDGPNTKRVPSDSRLSLGSSLGDSEVTVGIVSSTE